MPNDIPMFAWAGWGRVAVGNAHPSVVTLADEVTLTNDEDGVAVWLDRLLSGRNGSV
jgi:hydroxymethylpyrimidine pyrophosphatase-like HAD family hydrolase